MEHLIYNIVGITWFQKIWSRDQVQIWGLTSYSNTPRMEIPSAWLGTTEFIYLAVLQQSIQVDRVISMKSCDQTFQSWLGSCDHLIHLFSLRKFGCFLYMWRRCSFKSPCLNGSARLILGKHWMLKKVKRHTLSCRDLLILTRLQWLL